MTRWRIWLAAMAVLGGALLMACSDSDDDGDDGGDGGDQPTATESADGGDETPADTGDGGDGDGGDASADLSALAGQWANKEAKLVYDYTSTGGGSDSSGTFTLYWKPPDSWRVDITMDGDVSTILSTAGKTYICATDSCIESPTNQIPIPFIGSFLDADQYESFVEGTFAGVGIDKSDDTIAGQDAQCFTASSTVAGQEGSSEFCFSSDGIPLRVSGGGGGSEFSMEATSLEESVSDADFEPPYPILDLTG